MFKFVPNSFSKSFPIHIFKLIRCYSIFSEGNKDGLIPRLELKKRVRDKDNITKQQVKSSGPGGQHVNKTCSAVLLKDKATNISVKVDNSRDSVVNSGIAQKRLVDKLDLHYNGGESKIAKKIEKMKKQKDRQRRKSGSKYEVPEDKVNK